MGQSHFRLVWVRRTENSWDNFELLAWQERGPLDLDGDQLRVGDDTLVIPLASISRVSLTKQGRDPINDWVKLEWTDHDHGAVTYLADGSWAGWGGVLGGTRRLYIAIESTLRLLHGDPLCA